MIDPRFVLLGSLFALSGVVTYVRDTWRGVTAPNRVTWILWGIEPLLAFAVQRQEHIGWASLMTLVLGLGPIVVVAVSFHDPKSVWRIGRFDIACGVISILGLSFWATSNQPTVALVSFVTADAIAALPTLRKSFSEPESETAWNFIAVGIFALITLFTLKHITTAAALFPISILTMNVVISLLVITRVGPKWRGATRVAGEKVRS